ncbi:unnamed protein product [Oncorhynchus mykiss]|uniref:Uncharacterized protein n=1 Tax=Oncorhynchus mykiss TaxID=8022 RepID=A0A060WDG6_ONCMY|nr:unnamed protein product [Oncorhynchus mykiss]
MCPGLPHKDTTHVFSLVDTDMLKKVISQFKPSTCLLNPIPTTFFKTVFNCISEEVHAIVNQVINMFRDTFPNALKTVMVKPLLKESNLESSALNNFQPISNLKLRRNGFSNS